MGGIIEIRIEDGRDVNWHSTQWVHTTLNEELALRLRATNPRLSDRMEKDYVSFYSIADLTIAEWQYLLNDINEIFGRELDAVDKQKQSPYYVFFLRDIADLLILMRSDDRAKPSFRNSASLRLNRDTLWNGPLYALLWIVERCEAYLLGRAADLVTRYKSGIRQKEM